MKFVLELSLGVENRVLEAMYHTDYLMDLDYPN